MERLLQDARVDPAANNKVAVRYASERGHVNVFDLRIQDSRVDPSAYDFAVRCASKNGHLTVVDRLLQDMLVWIRVPVTTMP